MEQQGPFLHLTSGRQDVIGNGGTMENNDLLTARLKSGDRQAAEKLVDMYYLQVFLFFRRLGHNRQTSEDLTQECFFQAWRNIGRLRDGNALNSWLYSIAANASKMHWRENEKTVGFELNNLPDTRQDGGGENAETDQLGRLNMAVQRLPMKLRQVIVLHYLQYLTIPEAAEAAGLRVGTFKSRLNRAVKELKRQIG